MTQPTYEQLAEAYKELLRIALSVNDKMRREVDHVVYIGSSNTADDLREEVNKYIYEWNDFLYGNEE